MKLFERYNMGSLVLKNRVVMCPLTRSRAINNNPNNLMTTYYKQRNGAGLIITEGTSPSPNGLGYPRIPGIYNDIQTEEWSKVTDAVHESGAKIFCQLMHTGRVGHPLNLPSNGTILSPSQVEMTKTKMYVDGHGEMEIPTPRKMNHEEIKEAIKEYGIAAKNAMRAGFDGIEIHAANGYLIEQFLNSNINKRDDEYGGSIENRSRFLLEVANEIASQIGSEKIGVRISPYGAFNETGKFDTVDSTFEYVAIQLNRIDVTYIHMVDHSPMGTPEVPARIKSLIRNIFNNTLILSGGYDKEKAEKDLEGDHADLIAFGRPFISNPDLVKRMKVGADLNEYDQSTFYTPGAEGYIDYPTLKEELQIQ